MILHVGWNKSDQMWYFVNAQIRFLGEGHKRAVPRLCSYSRKPGYIFVTVLSVLQRIKKQQSVAKLKKKESPDSFLQQTGLALMTIRIKQFFYFSRHIDENMMLEFAAFTKRDETPQPNQFTGYIQKDDVYPII